jgi:hypothetical protein
MLTPPPTDRQSTSTTGEESTHSEFDSGSRGCSTAVAVEEVPVTWGERLRQWRVWLAIAGVALILLGWVGRAVPTK